MVSIVQFLENGGALDDGLIVTSCVRVETESPVAITKVALTIAEHQLSTVKDLFAPWGGVLLRDGSGKEGYYVFDSTLGLVCIAIEVPSRKNAPCISRCRRTVERLGTTRPGIVIVFEGPSGAGKSTASIFLAQALAHCPLTVERILFGAIKKRFSQGRWRPRNWLERYVMKLINLAHIHLNKKRGRLTLVDRYIYLQPNTALRRILQILAPRPDLLFVMIAPDEELRQRRGPEWAEETRAIYAQ